MTDNAIAETRRDLAAAFRWAVRHEFHEGICNHFSCMVPGQEDLFLINGHGLHWSEITAGNLLLATLDGEVVEGEHEIEVTALYIHARVHRQAPQARCVMHTHMPYTTTLASLKDPRLPVINQNALKFHDRIAYDTDYNGLVLDDSEGDRVARQLGNKSILMMGNHGVMVTGQTVAQAWHDLYYLERAARILVLAMSTGRELSVIPEEMVRREAQKIVEQQAFAEQHFAALRRVLDRDEPDYAD